jgi:hypothetical protein
MTEIVMLQVGNGAEFEQRPLKSGSWFIRRCGKTHATTRSECTRASRLMNQGVGYGLETATTRQVQSCSSD